MSKENKENKENLIDSIGDIIYNLGLLKPSEARERRRNARMLLKMYSKLERKLKKGGLTAAEQSILDSVAQDIKTASKKLSEV